MQKAQQDVPLKPVIPNEEVRLLRARLILEEALETIAALGFGVYVDEVKETSPLVCSENVIFDGEGCEPDLIEIADGCADLSVVTIGTLSACGIADKPLLFAIDDSNLRKFDPGSYCRDDGKWMKPPTWKKPPLDKVLRKQGWEEETPSTL